MSKVEQYREEMIRMQELSILDTIGLVDRAHACDLDTQEGRGDSKWLYGTANQALGIVAKLESILNKTVTTSTNTEDEEDKAKEAEAKRILSKVTKDYTSYKNKKAYRESKEK